LGTHTLQLQLLLHLLQLLRQLLLHRLDLLVQTLMLMLCQQQCTSLQLFLPGLQDCLHWVLQSA
jgi:hypothetical protein